MKAKGTSIPLLLNPQTLDLSWLISRPPLPYYYYYLEGGYFRAYLPSQVEGDQVRRVGL